MAGQLTLLVISPDRVVLDEQVDSVRLPGVDGSFGILPRHAPMIAAIEVGVMHYRQGGLEKILFVSSGFCEVAKNVVRVVAEAGEKPAEIDEQRAKEAEERARERLARFREQRGAAMTGAQAIDLLRAEDSLRRALKRQEAVVMASRS